MTDFLIVVAIFLLATVAAGLSRLVRGPGDAERMMAIQLLGTGGVAVLLLLATGLGVDAIVDVALTLALLAAFASIAFYQGSGADPGGTSEDGE